MIDEDMLGTNPLHRIRNRTAARILEPVWEKNYEANKHRMWTLHADESEGLRTWVAPRTADASCTRTPRFEDLESNARKLAVVIGAGPSLADNLKDLRHVSGLATLFCCDKAFPTVSQLRAPEIVTAINAENPAITDWWKNARTTKNSTLLAPVTADPRTFETWEGPICPVHVALPVTLSKRITEETGQKGMMGGSNVGVFSYLMAAQLQYDNIVLIGLDYCFRTREEALAKHVAGQTQYMLWEGHGRKGELRWTTWDWFDSAITFFEYARFVQRARGVRTVNCTGDGILYDGEYIGDCNLSEVLTLLDL